MVFARRHLAETDIPVPFCLHFVYILVLYIFLLEDVDSPFVNVKVTTLLKPCVIGYTAASEVAAL